MLCFQAESVPVLIHLSAFTYIAAIQKIAGIELHARFRSQDFHNTPRFRFVYARGGNRAIWIQVIFSVCVVRKTIFDLSLDHETRPSLLLKNAWATEIGLDHG